MPIITIMDIGGWLRSLGLEQYEAAFHANAVGADVLRDLTDRDLQQLGVLLGDRRKLLRAIAALDGAFAPAIAPRPTSLPISLETILAAAATRASPEQHGVHYSVSPPPQPSPMSSQRRPAEMIGDRPLVSPERTTSWLTASDDRDGDDIQAAEIGEPYEADEYHDDPATPRWRYCLVIVIAVIALAGMGAVGAFAYRAVSGGAVLPALPPIMKAENATNENIQSDGDNRPSDLSQTSIANAGASEEFVSRFPADNEEPPKTGTISPNPSASPASAFGSGGRRNGDGTTHPSVFRCSSGTISAAEGSGSGTRTVFLDAEEDQDGHSSIGRVRKSRYLGRGCQITRGKDERRSGGHSNRKSASA